MNSIFPQPATTGHPVSPKPFTLPVDMRRLLFIFGALFPCLLHGGQTSMSVAKLEADGKNIANNGTLVFAWNASDDGAVAPVVNGISFLNSQPAAVSFSGFLGFGNEGKSAAISQTMAHYTGDMKAVMVDMMGTNFSANGTVTMSGLKVGALYRVQFLHHQDVNGGNQRNLRVIFGTGPSATSYFDASDNTGCLTTIVFTADTPSQVFTFNPAGTARAVLNGVVLHEINSEAATPPPANGTLTLGEGGANDSFDGAIGSGGDFALIKNGAGTTTLTGANIFTGGTTVNAGALMVNNTTGSGLGTGKATVGKAATLGGTGAFTGDVIVQSGGTFAPGDGVQSLVCGAVAFESKSSFSVELDSLAMQGTEADLLVAGGDLKLAGPVELHLSDIAKTPTAFSEGKVFSLVNYTGTWNGGCFTSGGKVLADGGIFTVGLNSWMISYKNRTGGDNFPSDQKAGSFVNITAVPAPGTGGWWMNKWTVIGASLVALVLFGGGAVVILRRKAA